MLTTLNHLWTIASSGIHSRQRQLDVISHNVANANTIGFKASQTGFQALIRERTLAEDEAAVFVNANPGDIVQEGMGTLLTQGTRLYSQGAMKQSGDPLHIAIGGEGFFRVVDPAGRELYTRAGDFHRDAAGNLVNAKGYALQPAVTIPAEIADVYIDGAGRIWGRADGETDADELGAIQIALFASQDGLENVGENAFIPTPASGAAQMGDAGTEGRGNLMSGYLEESNVDLANEMADILRSQRAYSLSLRALHTADELFRLANELPRV